jgi:hypothetical protein
LYAVGGVTLLHPEEQVFEAMLEGWQNQQRSRNLRRDTISARCDLVCRFQRFTAEWPWRWRAVDVEDFTAHLRTEFEDRLRRLQQAGTTPDPKIAQVDRLKADNAKLKERLKQAEHSIAELGDFRTQALARLAAQHEEITRLRVIAGTSARVVQLPAPRAQTQAIGPC